MFSPRYLQNSHGTTHRNYSLEIIDAFDLDKDTSYAGGENKMLLWHGSRLTNWAGILSQGLRIAPPEAPLTGYMFGKVRLGAFLFIYARSPFVSRPVSFHSFCPPFFLFSPALNASLPFPLPVAGRLLCRQQLKIGQLLLHEPLAE